MSKNLRTLGLHLAAAEDEPTIEPATEAPQDGILDPKVLDFARRHASELYSSREETPTRLLDLNTLEGPIEPSTFFAPEPLSGSNFSGDSVNRSNYRAFMNRFKDVSGIYPIVGGHGSYAVAIRLNAITDEMLDVFNGMEDYASIDDEELSKTEYEASEEAWADWAETEFVRELTIRFPNFEDQIDAMSDVEKKSLFDKLIERSNAQWTYQSGGFAYIDTKKIAAAAVPEDFVQVATEAREDAEGKQAATKPCPQCGGTNKTRYTLPNGNCNVCNGTGLAPAGYKPSQYNYNPDDPQGALIKNPAWDGKEAATSSKVRVGQDKQADAGALLAKIRSDSFIEAYFEAALFSSTDNSTESGGEPLDRNYSIMDFDPGTMSQMVNDCEQFYAANDELLTDDNLTYVGRWDAMQMGGHDFWLTRNGHGSGYWDGDWLKPVADKLTAASKGFPEFDLYIGDDQKIHGS